MPINRDELPDEQDYAKSSILPYTEHCLHGAIESIMIVSGLTGKVATGRGLPEFITVEHRFKNEIFIAEYRYAAGKIRYILPQI